MVRSGALSRLAPWWSIIGHHAECLRLRISLSGGCPDPAYSCANAPTDATGAAMVGASWAGTGLRGGTRSGIGSASMSAATTGIYACVGWYEALSMPATAFSTSSAAHNVALCDPVRRPTSCARRAAQGSFRGRGLIAPAKERQHQHTTERSCIGRRFAA